MKLRTLFVFCLALIGACDCQDTVGPWEFEEPFVEPEASADADSLPDVINVPDMGPVELVVDVPIDHALNERTGLAIDDAGTVWLAYHRCSDQNCTRPILTVARRPRGGGWTFEDVKEQRGTFGIAVAENEQPILAFLDETDGSFKVARRESRREFRFWNLGVRRANIGDGLDLARDDDRVFVSFANDRGDPVALFVHENQSWRPLEELDIGNASAALERGLQADGNGNLFLVHQQGEFGEWGVAQYDLSSESWGDRTYFETSPALRPSSLIVTPEQEICIASMVNDLYLAVTCGDANSLDRQRWDFEFEQLSSYSSMIRGTDGALYLAYNAIGNTELRLARKAAGSDEWEFSTLFEGNSYGVSTVIDHDDLLVVSYYTCGATHCSLEVLSRQQQP